MTNTLGNNQPPNSKPHYKRIRFLRGMPGVLFCQPEKIGYETVVNTRVSILYSAAGTFIVEPLGIRVVRPHG